MADLAQIVQYEGDNNTFMMKARATDFNSGTQLIVHESQEAVFFMNGQALDLFGPGRHTLETQNIPLVRKMLNRPTHDQTPFHCEVYFINKTEQMALKWGTDARVQYNDPTYGFALEIGASGEMSFRVSDSRKLLVKIVGTETSLTHTAFAQKFSAFWKSKVKPYLARTMQTSPFSIFETDSHMDEISEALHAMLIPDYLEYGLSLEKFFVTNFVKPTGDRIYEEFRAIHFNKYIDVEKAKLRQQVGIIDQKTQAQRMVIESAALAQKRVQEGYTYQSERGYDVAEKVAQNEGAGNFSSAGIGLGMIGGVAGSMGTVVSGITTEALGPAMTPGTATGPDTAGDTGADTVGSFEQRLKKLELLKGKISDELYEAKMQEILSSI